MNGPLLLSIVIFVPMIFVVAFTPFLTRKTENFGVSIPESLYNREDFKTMRKKYAVTLIIIGLLFCISYAILSFQLSENIITILFTIIIVTYLIFGFLLYLPFHYKMKQIKESENWKSTKSQTIVVDMKFRQEILVYSNWWFLTSALIIIVTFLLTFIYLNRIPEKLPMHIDFFGNISYEEKSFATLLFIPGMQLALLVLFIFLNLIIKHTKQQVSVANPERSKKQNIIFRKRWSAYLICLGGLIELLLMYTQLTFIFPQLTKYTEIIIFSFVFLILLGTLLLAFITGQGGSRIKLNEHTSDQVIDRDDDQYWKLGQFYVNKNDPAIFVEKRFGVGWTNNWAHPLSWIVVIGILLVILIPVLLLR